MFEATGLLFAGVVCLFALVGTVYVGRNQVEKNYEATLKKRIMRLLAIYGITIVASLALVYSFL